MKLSEAILLGSTILAPQAGSQYSSETKAGCALGMAAIARGAGFRQVPLANKADKRTLGTEGLWGVWVLTMTKRPCKCWPLLAPREMRIKDIIAHIFDQHVMRKKDWTLERLVEWVETVEPDEAPRPVVRFRPGEVVRREARSTQLLQPSPGELVEWRTVRQAFEARPRSQHRSRLAKPQQGLKSL